MYFWNNLHQVRSQSKDWWADVTPGTNSTSVDVSIQ